MLKCLHYDLERAFISYITLCLIEHLSDGAPRTDSVKCLSAQQYDQYTVSNGENAINIRSSIVPHVKIRKYLCFQGKVEEVQ